MDKPSCCSQGSCLFGGTKDSIFADPLQSAEEFLTLPHKFACIVFESGIQTKTNQAGIRQVMVK